MFEGWTKQDVAAFLTFAGMGGVVIVLAIIGIIVQL